MQFTKTIGHEKQKRLFERAVKNGRLAHAYAFVGEEGIGKTTFALEFGELLGADPVLDVFILGEEDYILADEARRLTGMLALTPAGKCKVAIIRAESLSMESANALLKTLEEPPAHSFLFLVTSNFSGLLPTVASRVQKIDFSRSSDDEVQNSLASLNLDKESQNVIVTLGAGRTGLAMRLSRDQEFMERLRQFGKDYTALLTADLVERLKTAERICSMETQEIIAFLEQCLRQFAAEPGKPATARKLLTALDDLRSNVNVKLAMDNLFI